MLFNQGGGVFKEFLNALVNQAFDPSFGLFTQTSSHLLYPCSRADAADKYEFLGLVVGKALYEGILVDLHFTLFFLNKWLRRVNYIDDLQSLDSGLYDGLMYVKNYQGDVRELTLYFSIDLGTPMSNL